jgi:hypothetical protein
MLGTDINMLRGAVHPQETPNATFQQPQTNFIPTDGMFEQNNNNGNELDTLAQNINDNIIHEEFNTHDVNDDNVNDDADATCVNNTNEPIKFTMLYDIILLTIIFYIMSIESVKTFIGKYINIVNPVNGIVSAYGILFYGFLIAILFVFVKKVMLKKSVVDKLFSN